MEARDFDPVRHSLQDGRVIDVGMKVKVQRKVRDPVTGEIKIIEEFYTRSVNTAEAIEQKAAKDTKFKRHQARRARDRSTTLSMIKDKKNALQQVCACIQHAIITLAGHMPVYI